MFSSPFGDASKQFLPILGQFLINNITIYNWNKIIIANMDREMSRYTLQISGNQSHSSISLENDLYLSFRPFLVIKH